MRSKGHHRYAVWLACGLLLLACQSDGETRAGEEAQDVAESQETRRLDLADRTLVQRLDPDLEDAERQKLVEIEITDVVNPEGLRVSFELAYLPPDGERLLLGTFGLFPPDDPGEFLVATRGELRAGGSLELSMIVHDEIGRDDELRVELKRLALREE